jgi:hypothetical protein
MKGMHEWSLNEDDPDDMIWRCSRCGADVHFDRRFDLKLAKGPPAANAILTAEVLEDDPLDVTWPTIVKRKGRSPNQLYATCDEWLVAAVHHEW